MITIAVTGGVACGKSTVGGILETCGCRVIDTDDIVHGLLDTGGGLSERIRRDFGAEYMLPGGAVNRAALAQLVFGDDAERLRLNAVVHPAVFEETGRLLKESVADGICCMAVLIPLLFESGYNPGWHSTVCVHCSPGIQFARLCARGEPADLARKRIKAQMSPAVRIIRADVVLINDGTFECLQRQTLRWFEESIKKED